MPGRPAGLHVVKGRAPILTSMRDDLPFSAPDDPIKIAEPVPATRDFSDVLTAA